MNLLKYYVNEFLGIEIYMTYTAIINLGHKK